MTTNAKAVSPRDHQRAQPRDRRSEAAFRLRRLQLARTSPLQAYAAVPYISFMHAVLTTDTFEADAADAGVPEDEIEAMVRWLSANPQAGAVMQGTGGARKVRFAGKGKGKSGGYRTIHYYGGDDVPIFLLALINKGERDNLSKAERNALADELTHLADDYRAGVAARLEKLRRRI